MLKTLCAFVALALASSASSAADLSDTEARWLRGAWPVIEYAKQAALPIDVVVQPQPTPGAAPLALAFIDGRCKLVLSMRGNSEAQATLDRIRPELLDVTLELMAAHEVGHCRRYLDGAWYSVPAGFRANAHQAAAMGPELRAAYGEMQAMRREEGYGDLVGLAWTRVRHPERYQQLRDWLLVERSRDLVHGSPHDTIAWLRLAGDGAALASDSLFAGPAAVWASELEDDDD